jgi:pyruvate kinase
MDLYKYISAGQKMIIDKGSVELEVFKIDNGNIFCKVIRGDALESGKGVNLPGSKLNNPSITSKDKEQIKFAIEDNWDFIAGSFIRNTKDLFDIKEVTGNSPIKIIAKIEDQQGVDNIDEIIEVTDAVMIARGDMGSEIPLEKLPIIQKDIIFKCNKAAKPVIVATDMLESMIEKPMPTRAEITDVANAILDGADAIMTSGETSNGKYPVETVKIMSRIAIENEKYLIPDLLDTTGSQNDKISIAITNAAFVFAMDIEDINKIIVYTKKGKTPKLLSRLDLPIEIIALVENETLVRQLNLSKNVNAFLFKKDYSDRDLAVKGIIENIVEQKIVEKSDKILLVGHLELNEKYEHNHTNIFEYIDISNTLDK